MGRKYSWPEDQLNFLRKYIDEYLEIHKGKKAYEPFWAKVRREYNENFSILEQIFPSTSEGSLTAEQLIKFDAHKQTVLTATKSNRKLQVIKSPDGSTLKARRRAFKASEVYSKMYFKKRVKDKYEAEKTRLNLDNRQALGLKARMARESFEKEDEGTIKKVLARTEVENKKLADAQDTERTPLDYQRAIDDIPAYLRSALAPLSKSTGYTFTVLMGGPTPKSDGKLRTGCFHQLATGVVTTYAEHTDDFENRVIKPFGKYLKTEYESELCKNRAMTGEHHKELEDSERWASSSGEEDSDEDEQDDDDDKSDDEELKDPPVIPPRDALPHGPASPSASSSTISSAPGPVLSVAINLNAGNTDNAIAVLPKDLNPTQLTQLTPPYGPLTPSMKHNIIPNPQEMPHGRYPSNALLNFEGVPDNAFDRVVDPNMTFHFPPIHNPFDDPILPAQYNWGPQISGHAFQGYDPLHTFPAMDVPSSKEGLTNHNYDGWIGPSPVPIVPITAPVLPSAPILPDTSLVVPVTPIPPATSAQPPPPVTPAPIPPATSAQPPPPVTPAPIPPATSAQPPPPVTPAPNPITPVSPVQPLSPVAPSCDTEAPIGPAQNLISPVMSMLPAPDPLALVTQPLPPVAPSPDAVATVAPAQPLPPVTLTADPVAPVAPTQPPLPVAPVPNPIAPVPSVLPAPKPVALVTPSQPLLPVAPAPDAPTLDPIAPATSSPPAPEPVALVTPAQPLPPVAPAPDATTLDPIAPATSSPPQNDQATTEDRSKRTKKPSTRNQRMDMIGSTPPPPEPPASPDLDEASEWAVFTKDHLLSQPLGDAWPALVMAWFELEDILGFGSLSGVKTGLPTPLRPSEWSKWTSKSKQGPGRVLTSRPTIQDPAEVGAAIVKWWNSMQPRFRQSDSGMPLPTITPPSDAPDAWTSLCRPGPNGLVSILLLMEWWGHSLPMRSRFQEDSSEIWSNMVSDVKGVLLNLKDCGGRLVATKKRKNNNEEKLSSKKARLTT